MIELFGGVGAAAVADGAFGEAEERDGARVWIRLWGMLFLPIECSGGEVVGGAGRGAQGVDLVVGSGVILGGEKWRVGECGAGGELRSEEAGRRAARIVRRRAALASVLADHQLSRYSEYFAKSYVARQAGADERRVGGEAHKCEEAGCAAVVRARGVVVVGRATASMPDNSR